MEKLNFKDQPPYSVGDLQAFFFGPHTYVLEVLKVDENGVALSATVKLGLDKEATEWLLFSKKNK